MYDVTTGGRRAATRMLQAIRHLGRKHRPLSFLCTPDLYEKVILQEIGDVNDSGNGCVLLRYMRQ